MNVACGYRKHRKRRGFVLMGLQSLAALFGNGVLVKGLGGAAASALFMNEACFLVASTITFPVQRLAYCYFLY